jgi:bifunctional non-homologous end joining protein LigD
MTPAQPALQVGPAASDAWLPEVKLDGYRGQLHKARDYVIIFSKNGREFTTRFPGIRNAVLTLPCKSAVIDGEVVRARARQTCMRSQSL